VAEEEEVEGGGGGRRRRRWKGRKRREGEKSNQRMLKTKKECWSGPSCPSISGDVKVTWFPAVNSKEDNWASVLSCTRH